MKKRVRLIRSIRPLIFSCLILLSCSANGAEVEFHKEEAYKLPIISDVSTISFNRKLINIGRERLDVSLAYEAVNGKPKGGLYKSHSPEFINRIIKESFSATKSFLEKKGVAYRDCRGSEYNLVVTVVSRDVLHDHYRFRNFYKAHYGHSLAATGQTLWGFYSSTPEIENNSSILVSDISSDSALNEEVFAHELAHYWWDRLCLVSSFNISSENFASEFQKFYMRRKK